MYSKISITRLKSLLSEIRRDVEERGGTGCDVTDVWQSKYKHIFVRVSYKDSNGETAHEMYISWWENGASRIVRGDASTVCFISE